MTKISPILEKIVLFLSPILVKVLVKIHSPRMVIISNFRRRKNHQNWWQKDYQQIHTKIGEKSFTYKIKNFSESTNIFIKKITKIGDITLIENVAKIGEKSFTKKIENFNKSVKNSIKKSYQNWSHFTHWKSDQHWWKIIHQKNRKF